MALDCPRLTLVVALAAVLALDLSAAGRPKFTSTWKAPEAAGVSFAGQKVATLVMTANMSMRVSAEEQLAKRLEERGVNGIAAYRLLPREEMTTADAVRPWFERAGVQAVVTLRPISKDTQTVYTPTVWVQSSYSNWWEYYGYGWSTVYTSGKSQQETTLVVETLIHSVTQNKLLWAGVSTTTNRDRLDVYIRELADETVKEMKKQGIVKK